VKVTERTEARRLRAVEGMSMKDIATAVGVSLSSVSRWTRDIELDQAHQAALREANPVLNGRRLGHGVRASRAREARAAAQEHGRRLAAAGDPMHRLGCMLYWAEGSKGRNCVTFTNSDPDMVAIFLAFLRRSYATTDQQVSIRVNVFLGNDLELEAIEAWWLERLGLPPSSLRRAIVNRPSRGSLRKRRTLPYGTVRLEVCSTFMVQSIYGAIQECAEFERPEWLD
jgi:AcrR family transcriptional regulator